MTVGVLRSLACVALAGAVSLASACHRGQGEAAADAAPVESVVHGTVSVTGTSFEQQLVLDRSAGGGSLRLHASPADSAALVRVGGAEVAVRGDLDGRRLIVHGFRVTRVGNAPVADGVLRTAGGQIVLETANGRMVVANPPAALRSAIGARVWISGPLSTGPNSYGIIVPPS